MPDPKDPTPVRVVKRGEKFVVVGSDGRVLPGQEPLDDSVAAKAVAARVNGSWGKAKADRKAKGGPAITEAWSDAAREASAIARHAKGDLVQHREDGAQGRVQGPAVNGRVPVKFHTGDRDPAHVFQVRMEDLESLERPGKMREAWAAGGGQLSLVAPDQFRRFDPVKHPRSRGKFRRTDAVLKKVQRSADMGVIDTAVEPHGHEQFFETHPHHHGGNGLTEDERRMLKSKLYPHVAAVALSHAAVEESSLALPYRGSPLHLTFNPSEHPRGRIGRFIDVLGKLERAEHGSTVKMPHGITLRRDMRGIAVRGGHHSEVELGTAHAAAAEGLFRHDMHPDEVGKLGPAGHARLMDELEAGRRAAAASDMGDVDHLSARQRATRAAARGARQGFLGELSPEMFQKGRPGRVFESGGHARFEAALGGVSRAAAPTGRANETVETRDTRAGTEVYHPDGRYLGSVQIHPHRDGIEWIARDAKDKSLGLSHPSRSAAVDAIRQHHGMKGRKNEGGFEGVGDFGGDPFERYVAHQAAKGRSSSSETLEPVAGKLANVQDRDTFDLHGKIGENLGSDMNRFHAYKRSDGVFRAINHNESGPGVNIGGLDPETPVTIYRPKGRKNEEPQEPLHDAFHDVIGSRTYRDTEGNYRYRKANGGPGGPVTPWSDQARAAFPNHLDLVRAANDYIRPVTLGRKNQDVPEGGWVPTPEQDVPPATHQHMIGVFHDGQIKSPDELEGEKGHPVWFDRPANAKKAGAALLKRHPDARGFDVTKVNRGHYRTVHQEWR